MFRVFNECGRALFALSAAALMAWALGLAFPSASASTSRPPTQNRIKTFTCPSDDAECAASQICCRLPRARAAKLTTADQCKARRGRAVPKARCAGKRNPRKYKRVSMAQFRQILKTAKPMGRSSGKPVQTRLGEFALYDEYDPRRTMSNQGVHCMGGKSYPCWCEGAAVCRNFRAACTESNGALSCDDRKKRGQPTRCSCHK